MIASYIQPWKLRLKFVNGLKNLAVALPILGEGSFPVNVPGKRSWSKSESESVPGDFIIKSVMIRITPALATAIVRTHKH
jgi:hypothetical protein